MPFTTAEDGVRIHYEIEGDGPPLVLHHAFAESLGRWREAGYVERLRDRFRLVLLDARGHGQSDRPTTPEGYDFRTRVLDVAAVLEAAEIQRAHFWGYSMGGIIGLSASIYAPQRFLSLVIGGASPYGGSDLVIASRAFEDAWPSYANHEGADHDAWAALWQETARFRGAVQALQHSRTPFLLYSGEHDRGPARGIREFCGAHPAEHFTVRRTNHPETFEAVDAVVPRVLQFLDDVPAS